MLSDSWLAERRRTDSLLQGPGGCWEFVWVREGSDRSTYSSEDRQSLVTEPQTLLFQVRHHCVFVSEYDLCPAAEPHVEAAVRAGVEAQNVTPETCP